MANVLDEEAQELLEWAGPEAIFEALTATMLERCPDLSNEKRSEVVLRALRLRGEPIATRTGNEAAAEPAEIPSPDRRPARGYSINGHGGLHIGYLPERKAPALYVVRDGEITAIAYFRSDAGATEAIKMLDWLVNASWRYKDAGRPQ